MSKYKFWLALRWTDSWKRFVMHLGVGGYAAWLVKENPATGITFTLLFLGYEFINEWGKADKSYKDVIGALVMFGIVAGILEIRS